MLNTTYSTLGKQLKKVTPITASQILHYHPPECQIKAEGKLMPLKLCVKAVEEWSLFLIGSGVLIFGIWLIYDFVKPIRDDDGTILDDEFSALPLPEKCWKRTCRELNYYKERFLGLRNGKILPDPLDKQPQYTLVLEFTDLLVHPDWTYQTNWRFKKRPGVDQFLEQLVPYFEIVIYTDLYAHMFFPLLGRLNPNVHMFGLARGSTRYINGHNVKDLDVLNRNLSKVIVIDWNKISIQLQPQNAILIPRWNGNDDDTTLIELSAFLTMIHATNVADVRDIIKYYQQFDNPLEAFRENERKLLKQMKKWEKYKNND
ncbi:mitochondrial import inner membrane translocase subunit TIM50-C-like [Aphidius gifuensis]|uniref:mitochondrial import inner membrane translocase subunit TIM50-C-like n=1 Tax=Aphidius gifuensis TaxID=684658 RepID=UPI001CDD42BC|nr:mitochondrial import inner membrane translocase subunit TIM50-C-like [Aphidius gifuensis]